MGIAENINKIRTSLPGYVCLVAVSKTKSDKDITEAYHTGHRDFGENYVQELTGKYERLPKDIRWHFIGHLQSNKVKYIAPFIHLIHGVDSFKLLKEINKQASKNNRVIDCLLQIHIAREETKFGLDEKEFNELIHSTELLSLKNICIKGVMGMASHTGNEKQVSEEFGNLHRFFTTIKNYSDKISGSGNPLEQLLRPTFISSGMSHDYLLALKQNSNMIRVGSLIFGERNLQV
ncbi:MAG: YggS family pyridoxal phosphate-dependent enzyme [Bacteroidota bacterium]